MSAKWEAIEDAISRASASASRLAQAARNSISSSAKYREQQHAATAAAEKRVQALLDHHAAVTLLVKHAKGLIVAVDKNHDEKAAPARYTVPWAKVVALRAAVEQLEATGSEQA